MQVEEATPTGHTVRTKACRQPELGIQGRAGVWVRKTSVTVRCAGLRPCVHVCNGWAGTRLTCACNRVHAASVHSVSGSARGIPASRTRQGLAARAP